MKGLLPISILIWILISFVEIIISSLWIQVYFKKGIPLFRRSFNYSKDFSFSIQKLSNDLSLKFHRILLHTIDFKNINDFDIAFHEKRLSLPFYIRISIMHGIIHIDNANKRITVTGFVDWHIIWLFYIFPLNILSDPFMVDHIYNMLKYFFLTIMIILIILYFKFKLYKKILEYIKSKFYNTCEISTISGDEK